MNTIDDLAHPTLVARVLARLDARSLDARLAHGAAPADGPLLAVRAAWLTSPRHRTELADAWEHVIDTAHGTGRVLDPRAPIARQAVLDAAPEIRALVDVLRSPAPVRPVAVARVRDLLVDGTSAVYTGDDLGGRVADLAAELCRAGG